MNHQPCPDDLFIPEHALEVNFDLFSGPLDLLLYLIKQQDIDILDLSVLKITEEYLSYLALMKQSHFELSSDYLLMAATLIHMKSKMLLPQRAELQQEDDEEDLEDTRSQLIQQLQQYEIVKQQSLALSGLSQSNRDFWTASLPYTQVYQDNGDALMNLGDLMLVHESLQSRQSHVEHYQIHQDILSVEEKMQTILSSLKQKKGATQSFFHCIDPKEGRLGVATYLMALMALLKQGVIDIHSEGNQMNVSMSFVSTQQTKKEGHVHA